MYFLLKIKFEIVLKEILLSSHQQALPVQHMKPMTLQSLKHKTCLQICLGKSNMELTQRYFLLLVYTVHIYEIM